MHEWLGACKPNLSDIKIIEITYMIFWNRANKGMTIKKYCLDSSENQKYDFEFEDEVDRLIEILSANWDHPCFANKNDDSSRRV